MKKLWENQKNSAVLIVFWLIIEIFFSSTTMADNSSVIDNLDIENDTKIEGLLRLDGDGVFMDQQLRADYETTIKFKPKAIQKASESNEIDLLDSFSDNTQSKAKSIDQTEDKEMDLLDSFSESTPNKAKSTDQAENKEMDLLDSFSESAPSKNKNTGAEEGIDLLESFSDGTKKENDEQTNFALFGEESIASELHSPELKLRFLGIIDPAASDHDRENQIRFFSGGVKFFAGEQNSVFIGKESYIWGKADYINPTDVNNSEDFTEFLMKDQNRRKVPRYLVKYDYIHDDDKLQFIFMPGYEQHALPNKESRWCQSRCQLARPVNQPLTSTEPGIAVFNSINQPAMRFNLPYSEYSLRYLSRANWLDYSFMVHNGFDKFPVYRRTFTSPFSVDLERLLLRRWSFGGDLSFTLGEFGIRVEALFQPNSLMHFSSNSNEFFTDSDGLKEVNQLNWIVGVDWSSSSDTYVNLQFAQNKLFDSGRFFRNTFNMLSTLQVSQKRLVDDDFEASILFYYEYADNSFAISPELSYEFNSQIKLTLGGFYFGGKRTTFLGDYTDNSNVFTKLVYTF